VVRVNVSIDGVEDIHLRIARCVEIHSDVTDRVDDRSASPTATAKQIGNRNGIRMQELLQYPASLQCRLTDVPTSSLILTNRCRLSFNYSLE